MTNSRFRAKLVIVKQDGETKTPLSGAGFRLFNASGEMVGEGCTDENGQITFENLKKGSYTYQSTKHLRVMLWTTPFIPWILPSTARLSRSR